MKLYPRICWCAKPQPNRRTVALNRDGCKCSRCHGFLTALAYRSRKA